MKRELPSDFPDRIKQLREKLVLTQEQLANLLGVSFASVNRWENEQSRPSASSWRKFTRIEAMGIEALQRPAKLEQSLLGEEEAAGDVEPEGLFSIDFSASPEAVRAVVEGERLAYGHLANPAFATEVSRIDPLPHQRIAVYERMLTQPRLRFLLADDAGAGKTIMAGLYIRDMLARRLIRRVLIVPPAGLVGNWRREMHNLFSLPFRIASGSEARDGNPFIGPESDLLIVSVDTLSRERMFARLQEWAVDPYDLVIFDEAHKLSADQERELRVRKTDRYRLAEALVGAGDDDERWKLSWYCNHLLLLTATPHMGKDYPYYCLWRLLEPDVLTTSKAFRAYPDEARQKHFIRRVKEEMVHLDGSPIYPERISDTLSYDLTQGEVSEQHLYDETTAYMQYYYNRAKILNRSAARLAISVFQRRLASSTYALMCSFQRRLERLERLIDDIHSGRLSEEQLQTLQRKLGVRDLFDDTTGDEESPADGREENEIAEENILAGVVAVSLADLETERLRVQGLLDLAHHVYEDPNREDSKFARLREVLQDERYRGEKIIVFTEYRDTLDFLVRRLEGIGFTGQVARIHGGMDYLERDEQVDFFHRPASEGGARYLVATDAAGEGINLQFAWLMINYDIPWNPARLEQRMGRIHRYGQQHDPVIILNVVAGKTREGHVLKTLLDKLERIRKELGSGKVFDVIGRLFKGVSLKSYMERALTEDGVKAAEVEIEGTLTEEQVQAQEEWEHKIYGEGGDVRKELPRLRASIGQEPYVQLLPGYVRRFVERAAPLMDVGIEGDLGDTFFFRPLRPGALDTLWPVLESYPEALRAHLTVYEPQGLDKSIWLHPGEAVFDAFRAHVCSRLCQEALRGAVFVDPTTVRPYLFYLVMFSVQRKADPARPALAHPQTLVNRLVGLRQEEDGLVEQCALESLLLLRGGPGLTTEEHFAARAAEWSDLARAYAIEQVVRPLAEEKRQALLRTLLEREDFLRRGYAYQEAELANARKRQKEKADTGDSRAKGELTRIKERQRALAARREEALLTLHREPELVAPGEVAFLARALVVPSTDPEDRKRYDREIELAAMRMVRAHEEAAGAIVRDVSTPELARASGLAEHPGFDLLSLRPAGEERAIEVKGRAGIGAVELSENEFSRACNLQDRYWLYVVYDCVGPYPQLLRIPNPYRNAPFRPKGGVIIDAQGVFQAAEQGD